jgi:hypothetical protein
MEDWKMSARRADGSRRNERAFRPSLDGQIALEPKVLLSHFHQPYGVPGQVRTAAAGSAVEVTTLQGQTFRIGVTHGRVQAKYMGNNQFAVTVVNSAIDSVLRVNPIIDYTGRGTAHTYNSRPNDYPNTVNIGSLTVKSGTIGSILGYRDAVLTGPLVSPGASRIDRIAFYAVNAGASINTGGDVNILNVLNNLTVSGKNTGVVIGRDLNALTVGGNITVSKNAVFSVGRDTGLTPQAQQGTAPDIGSNSAVVTGNLVINSGGKFIIGQHIVGPFVVQGSIAGASNITVNGIQTGFFANQLPFTQLFSVGGTITA